MDVLIRHSYAHKHKLYSHNYHCACSEAAPEVLDAEVHQAVLVDAGRQPRTDLPQVAAQPTSEPGLALVILALEAVVAELQHGQGPVVVLRHHLQLRLGPRLGPELLQGPGQGLEQVLLEGHQGVVDREQGPVHIGPGPHPVPDLLCAPVIDLPDDVVKVSPGYLSLDSLKSVQKPVPGVASCSASGASDVIQYLLTSDALVIKGLQNIKLLGEFLQIIVFLNPD